MVEQRSLSNPRPAAFKLHGMTNAALDRNEDWTPDALKRRIGSYISRIVSFNSGWGIHGRGKRPDGFFGHFFRFDANRMTRMVLACEHLIRCMIIWTAVRAYKEGDVQPARFRLPPRGPRGSRSLAPPMDADFALRGLPLYEPKLPPFLISLPEPTKDAALSATHRESGVSREAGGQTKTALSAFYANGSSREQTKNDVGAEPASLRVSGSSKRKRNDQILDCNMLVERSHRLSKLLDEIDPRARRLAARWAGYLTNLGTDDNVEHPTSDREGAGRSSQRRGNEAEQNEHAPETGSVCSPPWKGGLGGEEIPPEFPDQGGGSTFLLNPLKTYWPPPDLLTEAPDDEAEDLRELHDVALRAIEAFHELCG